MSLQSGTQGTRENFSTRLGFILIAVGCAIGLGNVWRFPYITGQNGGAVFVFIYLACLLVLGVPCVMMELAVGRASRSSVARAFEKTEPAGTKWHLAKYPMLIGPYILMSFYTVLTGWLFYYISSFISNDFASLRGLPAKEMSEGIGIKFSSLLSDPVTMYGYTIVVIALGMFVCWRGVQKGVENITKPMMLALFVLLAGLAIYSLTLDGAAEGLKYYLYPDFEKAEQVGWMKVCYQALNQAFFTLSVGQGSLLIFGSYIKKNRSLAHESLIIAGLDTLVALLAGLIIFPSCATFNIDPSSGPNLLFISMLNVFVDMEFGQFVGFLFFIFMGFAAFTTVITVMEGIVANMMEMIHCSRRVSVLINLLIIGLISLPCVLGFNVLSDVHPLGPNSGILDLEDFIVSNNILPLGSLFFVIFCTMRYGWGFKNFLNEVNQGQGFALPYWVKFYMAWVLPIIIMVILIIGYLDVFDIWHL